jgi:hypothetical protein
MGTAQAINVSTITQRDTHVGVERFSLEADESLASHWFGLVIEIKCDFLEGDDIRDQRVDLPLWFGNIRHGRSRRRRRRELQ